MTIKADRDGFLIGERIAIDTEWIKQSLDIWNAIRLDIASMRNALEGKRGGFSRPAQARQESAYSAAAQPRAQVRRPVAPIPRTDPAAIPRRASAPASERARDSRGRYVSATPKPFVPGKRPPAGGDHGDGGGDSRRDIGPGMARRIFGAITDGLRGSAGTAAQGVEQIDPVLGAAKELHDIASPLTGVAKSAGGGLFKAWRERSERKKQKDQAKETAKETVKAEAPWYRRILRALGQGSSGGDTGGGLFSGLSSLFSGGGLIKTVASRLGLGAAAARGGGLLARLTGIGRGSAGVAGAAAGGGRLSRLLTGGKGLLGKAGLPITAIFSAVESFNTSTDEYARRLGMDAGESVAKDTVARTLGTLQDLGNTITFGLADRVGNWIGGNGFVRSGTPAQPNPKASRSGSESVTAASIIGMGTAGPLLDLIGSKEGGKAGYDAFWSGSRVQPSKPLSQMTFAEVKQWQQDTLAEQTRRGVRRNRQSSAAGRYQFISGTLKDMQRKAGLSDTDLFSAENQDKLAMALLDNSPGSGLSAWRSGKASDAQFANYVASQWASIKDSSGFGRYNAAGFNRASVGADAVLDAARASFKPRVPAMSRARTPAIPPMVSRGTAVPKASDMKVPPAPPPPPMQIGSTARPSDAPEIIVPQPLSQNVSHRGIANLATGGMGGGSAQRMS